MNLRIYWSFRKLDGIVQDYPSYDSLRLEGLRLEFRVGFRVIRDLIAAM